MTKIKINTVKFIEELSYPDFVGLINQWNTPPGSYSTISKLATFSHLNKDSNLLEVGCSTGFSSREFSSITGCRGVGIDISQNSIKMANYNKQKYATNIQMTYKVIDACNYNPNKRFSHVMVGGNLKFFSNPEKMMSRCIEMIKDGGFILATPYYEVKKMPEKMVRNIHKTLGIPMSAFSNFTYKKVIDIYNKLEIIFEEQNILTQETNQEIEYYSQSVISRACKIYSITNQDIYDVMYKRLIKIRKLINLTRPYQKYVIFVLRYRKSVYPNRYVALF